MKDIRPPASITFKLFAILLVILLFGISPVSVTAQTSDTLSLSRYQMANKMKWANISKHVYNISLSPNWKSDNSGFWFSEQSSIGRRYRHLDLGSMKIADVFDHAELSRKLNEHLDKDMDVDAKNLGLNDLSFLSKGMISFRHADKKYKYDLRTLKLTEKEIEETSNPLEAASPDGKWIAFVRDHNLYVRLRDGNEEVQLSSAGKQNYEYASYYGWFDKMEGEGSHRPERFSVNWSPDSKRIYCNIVDTRDASKMYMLDHSVDTLYRPKLISYYRGSPGDTNVIYYRPVTFDILSKKETLIDVSPVPHFMGIYPTWNEEGTKLFLTHWERGFKKVSISEVDLSNGALQELCTEDSDVGIEYSVFVPHYSKVNDLFLFTSERSGWKQLYALDPNSKKVSTITDGTFYIKELEYIDEENRLIYFTAAGKDKLRNPYHNYLYRVNFDGSNLRVLTPEDATHDISMSKDGKYFVDNISSHDQPTRSVLRESELGNIKAYLASAETGYLDKNSWKTPQSFKVKAGDRETDIFGLLYKPSDFDSVKTYPIIDATYTGPHTSRYPSSFYATLRSNAPALAELGFVVIRMDGRGSNHRSKAFRSYSYKNLGGGLDDHVVAIRSLGKEYSWIDTSRVGIFGHSAGGYDAGRALLAYPDFYKVGVASSADHDHRMEKAWWPEMYMGWPVGDEYHNQSNITNAKNLKGKLLLVHGALDDNVNVSATMKLCEALIKADKEFDLLIMPSQRHGYSGKYTEYFAKKRWNYFVEHLLGKTPRWDY